MLIVISVSAKAQIYIGVESGLTKNYLNADISDLSYTTKKPLYGFNIAVPIDCRINHSLSIRSSVSYVQKNYSLNRTGDFKGIYQEFKNSYLQIPLLVAIQKKIKDLSFFLQAGGYGAYWNDGIVKGTIPNIFSVSSNENDTETESFNLTSYNEKYSFDKRKDNRLEFGFVVGCGMDYALNKKSFLRIEADYYDSVTDQQKNYMPAQYPRKNQTVTLLLGYFYKFH
jgi:opacity protein-like surface antigen